MIIVIDAYNVLKQVIKASIATEHERKLFINQVNAYAKKSSHYIVLVFDGGSLMRSEEITYHAIHLVYAGRGSSADDYIKEYAQKHKNKEMLVVSSDNALALYIRQLGIPTIAALPFYRLMQERTTPQSSYGSLKISFEPIQTIAVNAKEKVKKETIKSELDMLMEQGSKILLHKSEDKNDNEKNSYAHKKKLTKQEKKLAALLKKL